MPNKKILLGVTGSIAAYKACDIIKALREVDFDVKVITTKDAEKFVTPLTLEICSGHKVFNDIFNDENSLTPHVSYASQADSFLIAPATANTIAKLANGIADNALTACCLAATCKKIVAPAMNTFMYENPATQKNLKTLKKRGFEVIDPISGNLACGDVGIGKLAEVETIVKRTLDALKEEEVERATGIEPAL